MIQLDRRHFIASLGGAAAVRLMSSEAKAEALESYMIQQLNGTPQPAPPGQPKKFPTAADIDAQIETRSYRRGVGNLFLTTQQGSQVKHLAPMPEKPTFVDFFNLRLQSTANHCLQSANLAKKHNMPEDIVLACLLHDLVHALIKTDHGYWGADLYRPYVSDRIHFAVRYH